MKPTITRDDVAEAIRWLLAKQATCPKVAAAVIRTLTLLVCLASAARADTLDPVILHNHGIGVRMSDATIRRSALAAVYGGKLVDVQKPLRITGLEPPRGGAVRYLGNGAWATR
jgi:hypothetical protein